MPAIGELARGRDIGKPANNGDTLYVWYPCEKCGRTRWVQVQYGKARSKVCNNCSRIEPARKRRAEKAAHWKGGRCEDGQGYLMVRLQPDDPFYSMSINGGYIKEHRLVMARHLKRCLEDWEIPHHKNENKQDNRIENLELLSRNEHIGFHRQELLAAKINR